MLDPFWPFLFIHFAFVLYIVNTECSFTTRYEKESLRQVAFKMDHKIFNNLRKERLNLGVQTGKYSYTIRLFSEMNFFFNFSFSIAEGRLVLPSGKV